MNFKFIGFICTITLLFFIFLKYNIVNSSNDLLDAAEYKAPVRITLPPMAISHIEAAVAQMPEFYTDMGTGKPEPATIQLFHSLSCPACVKFYATWKSFSKQVRGAEISEIECSSDPQKCREFGIKRLPTIVISTGTGTGTTARHHQILEAPITLEKLVAECKTAHIELNAGEFEAFTDYISAAQVEAEGNPRKSKDPDCPYMSFYEADKNNYCADSDFMYGCINATPGSGVDAFDGAFGVVTSYLNALPESNIEKKKKCLSQHGDVVKSWNLCDPMRLAAKRGYSADIAMHVAKPRFSGANYDDNKDAVDAINYACNVVA